MTATAAPLARTTRGDGGRAEVLLVRFLGVAGFLTLPVALSLLSADGATHSIAAVVGGYSPEYLVHGAVWTLVGSAFLLPRVAMIGPTTIFTVLCFLPYALARGAGRAAGVFVATHVMATLCVAAVVLGGVLLGWSAVQGTYHQVDVGASAGLAGVVGALGVLVHRRSPLLGLVLLGGVALFFLDGLVLDGGSAHGVTDVEHLVALATGIALEARLA